MEKFSRSVLAMEEIILKSRYALYPLYIATLLGIPLIGVDFVMEYAGYLTEEVKTHHTLLILSTLDSTMIANLIWLISAGGYYVFIHPFDQINQTKNKPRSLNHISTGLLKEKMAGSIVGVSSVHLLTIFLYISVGHEIIEMRKVFSLLAIHVAFIIGFLAFNHANKADHHQQKEIPDADSHH